MCDNNSNISTIKYVSFGGVVVELSRVESGYLYAAPNSRSVTTAPDDGSCLLEKLSLQQALEGTQRQFGGS